MQTYQEVTEEILLELPNAKGDLHIYFFKLKEEQPVRFERLKYDTNGHIPYSKDLESIIMDLVISGKY